MCFTGYMLDTHLFDRVAKGQIPFDVINGRKVFATHVQRDELGRTNDPQLRARLLKTFSEIDPILLVTDTSVFDNSKFDETKWSAENGTYERLLTRITGLDSASHKRSRDPLNQSRDARIAEAAMNAGLTLVTDDRNLLQATSEAGGRVVSLATFREGA